MCISILAHILDRMYIDLEIVGKLKPEIRSERFTLRYTRRVYVDACKKFSSIEIFMDDSVLCSLSSWNAPQQVTPTDLGIFPVLAEAINDVLSFRR